MQPFDFAQLFYFSNFASLNKEKGLSKLSGFEVWKKSEHQKNLRSLSVFFWCSFFIFESVEDLSFAHFGADLSRKISPYFVAGISKVTFRRLLRVTSVGNADRKGRKRQVLQWLLRLGRGWFLLFELGTIFRDCRAIGDKDTKKSRTIRKVAATFVRI